MKEIYHTVNRLQSFQSWNNGDKSPFDMQVEILLTLLLAILATLDTLAILVVLAILTTPSATSWGGQAANMGR